MNILLVDDEEPILEILSETLRSAGIEVQVCNSGEAALAYLADHPVEVMVSDLRMPPGMNGVELLQKAREQDPDLEMVILTGFGNLKSAVEALRAGAYDYLSKPIDSERLIQTIKNGIEKRRLKIENRMLFENLKEASRLKTDFLHGMSHEIRTPLGHITGFAEILEQTVEGLTDKQKRYLHNIQGAARRLLVMFDDMLQYADMSLVAEFRPSPILVSDIIRQVRSTLSDMIHTKNLDLQVHLPAPDPVVSADFSICEKMLEVVVKNAVQFSPPESVLNIVCSVDSEPHVTDAQRALLTVQSDHWLHIAVTDQGPGIAPEAHERIFNLFEQGDGSLAREHEGTGLGLALGQNLAKRHNGLITLQSAPDQGSTFTLVIPVSVSHS